MLHMSMLCFELSILYIPRIESIMEFALNFLIVGNMSLSLAIKRGPSQTGAQKQNCTEAKLQEELDRAPELHNHRIRFIFQVYENHGRSEECHCSWPGTGNADLPSSLFPSVL